MPLQDHKAPNRNLAADAMSPEQYYKGFRHERGIVPGSLNAIPKNPGASASRGIPHVGQAFFPTPEPAPFVRTCLIPTKKGEDCKAKPIKGRDYCIGHSRTLEEDFEPSGD